MCLTERSLFRLAVGQTWEFIGWPQKRTIWKLRAPIWGQPDLTFPVLSFTFFIANVLESLTACLLPFNVGFFSTLFCCRFSRAFKAFRFSIENSMIGRASFVKTFGLLFWKYHYNFSQLYLFFWFFQFLLPNLNLLQSSIIIFWLLWNLHFKLLPYYYMTNQQPLMFSINWHDRLSMVTSFHKLLKCLGKKSTKPDIKE